MAKDWREKIARVKRALEQDQIKMRRHVTRAVWRERTQHATMVGAQNRSRYRQLHETASLTVARVVATLKQVKSELESLEDPDQ